MAEYPQSLNKDTVNNLFTSSRYDSDISKWVNDTALWHQNDSGVLVPTGSANPLPTQLSGSNFEVVVERSDLPISDGNRYVGTSSGGITGWGYPLDVSGSSEIMLWFQNTSDVGVTIQSVYYYDDLTKQTTGESITSFSLALSVPAGSRALVYADGADNNILLKPLEGLVFYFLGAGTPTNDGKLNFKAYRRKV